MVQYNQKKSCAGAESLSLCTKRVKPSDKRFFLWTHLIPDRTAVHKDDRMMSVFSYGCCCQTVDKSSIGRFEYSHEILCRNMMTLINDNHTVLMYDVLYGVISFEKRLHQSNIHFPSEFTSAPSKLSYMSSFSLLSLKAIRSLMKFQELFQPDFPLIR